MNEPFKKILGRGILSLPDYNYSSHSTKIEFITALLKNGKDIRVVQENMADTKEHIAQKDLFTIKGDGNIAGGIIFYEVKDKGVEKIIEALDHEVNFQNYDLLATTERDSKAKDHKIALLNNECLLKTPIDEGGLMQTNPFPFCIKS